jgi:ATP-dependent helicase/nuclease subunit A
MRAAAERGKWLHALFERLPAVAPDERRPAAERWLRNVAQISDDEQMNQIMHHALAVIEAPEHAALFSVEALAEAPIAAVVGEAVVSGTVDRLLVTGDRVQLVDFKTGRAVPSDAGAVPVQHLRQMAAYVAALGVIFPGRRIEAALLYTAGAKLIALDDALLEPHKPGFPVAEHNLSGSPVEPPHQAS